ncbi:MAG: DUF4062 domain-containing protein [Candidatus Binataceae bacterium]|nr:DUF4062 domain-containing protein [Candidatus Binataceae bacterium]
MALSAMPRTIIQYRIFIGSPGGLDKERKCFSDRLERFSNVHGEEDGVVFRAVAWEDTLSGVGRPQELINEDLKQCDYAVFVLHDRWGRPTGKYSGHGRGVGAGDATAQGTQTPQYRVVLQNG